MTPGKDQKTPNSKLAAGRRIASENANPNNVITTTTPISISKSKKSAPGIARRAAPVAMHDRKFLVAKKAGKKEDSLPENGLCKCKEKCIRSKKCRCVAYETLRASQEEFFKNRAADVAAADEGAKEKDQFESAAGEEDDEYELSPHTGSARIRKIRNRLMEEARSSIPDFGSGRVKHLTDAFERLLSIRKSDVDGEDDDKENLGLKWALPGLHVKDIESTDLSSSIGSLPPPGFVFTARPSDSNSFASRKSGNRNSGGGRGVILRLNSSCAGRIGDRICKKVRPKATVQEPFNLMTEQRGVCKQEEFQKKVEELFMEEERLRIPIAQGLPWTTEQAQYLAKPPVKESTIPLEFQLHSDVRAMERAEFDDQVAEKLTLIDRYRREREREQKLQEEEDIRRERRAMIPKAQPMPFFDRPFIPRRSIKLPTIPKEPNLKSARISNHNKKVKCCSSSWSEADFLAPRSSTDLVN